MDQCEGCQEFKDDLYEGYCQDCWDYANYWGHCWRCLDLLDENSIEGLCPNCYVIADEIEEASSRDE